MISAAAARPSRCSTEAPPCDVSPSFAQLGVSGTPAVRDSAEPGRRDRNDDRDLRQRPVRCGHDVRLSPSSTGTGGTGGGSGGAGEQRDARERRHRRRGDRRGRHGRDWRRRGESRLRRDGERRRRCTGGRGRDGQWRWHRRQRVGATLPVEAVATRDQAARPARGQATAAGAAQTGGSSGTAGAPNGSRAAEAGVLARWEHQRESRTPPTPPSRPRFWSAYGSVGAREVGGCSRGPESSRTR